MSRIHPLMLAATVVLLALGRAPSAIAQIEITPHVGLYVPLGTLVDEASLTSATLVKRQVGTVMVGTRVYAGLAERVGLRGTIAYAPTQVAVTTVSSTEDIGAGIVLASLRGTYFLTPRTSRLSLHIGSGIGVVDRHGRPWRGIGGTTDLALASSIGGQGGVEGSSIRITFELEHYLTRAQFDGAEHPQKTTSSLHHDLLLSLGIAIAVSGE